MISGNESDPVMRRQTNQFASEVKMQTACYKLRERDEENIHRVKRSLSIYTEKMRKGLQQGRYFSSSVRSIMQRRKGRWFAAKYPER